MTVEPDKEKSDLSMVGANAHASSSNVCHALPCNVDFEGMAPAHIYFKPVQVEDGILASSFRGRGLIATEERIDDTAKPYLLSLEENRVQVKAPISNIVEWHHDHNIKSIKYQDIDSRVQLAKEWSAVAKAVSVLLSRSFLFLLE